METLHDAIRQVVRQFGHSILQDAKVVNILSDYGGFRTMSATKPIIKFMVAQGYCQKIIELGRTNTWVLFAKKNTPIQKPSDDKWIDKLQQLGTNIAHMGGFELYLVTYVLDCIVYGLEWTENPPSMDEAYTQTSPCLYYSRPVNVSTQAWHPVSTGRNMNPSDGVSYQQIGDTQFVVMTVSPLHAEVFIDGQQQYVENGIMATELPVGEHYYKVKADSYKTENGSFILSQDNKITLSINLKLEEHKIELTIIAKENDAEIWINGIACGQGKWKGLLDAGQVIIECMKPKCYTYKETKQLGDKQEVCVKIPALQPISGNLKINVQPYGSEVLINGEKKGATPLLLSDIPIGKRHIRIVSPEGSNYDATVEIRERQVTNVNHIIPSLFLKDYSSARIGDYFYEDGSISHERVKGKKIVGMVFSLETSEEQKKHGWTHGQIIALEDADLRLTKFRSWGIPSDKIFQYAIRKPYYIHLEDDGYQISHTECIINDEEFAPFYVAANYAAPLPFGITSGWHLPSANQWLILYTYTMKHRDTIWPYLNLLENGLSKCFATATIKDKSNAWVFTTDRDANFPQDLFSERPLNIYLNQGGPEFLERVHVRSVAAF